MVTGAFAGPVACAWSSNSVASTCGVAGPFRMVQGMLEGVEVAAGFAAAADAADRVGIPVVEAGPQEASIKAEVRR